MCFSPDPPKKPKIAPPPQAPSDVAEVIKKPPGLAFEAKQNQLSTAKKLGGLGFGTNPFEPFK